jgi:YVTN family beta-propeller protein
VPPGSGVLHVYLRALPPEAAGILAEVGSVAAVARDGTAHALTLVHATLDGTAPPRQRLLARGTVPSASYVGLEMRFASARLGAGSQAAELAVPETPQRIELSFAVAEQQALAVQLALLRDVPVVQAYAFEPRLSAGIPSATELAPSATAVATLGGPSLLTVFHKLSGDVFAVLRTGASPRAVAYDPERQLAYVACSAADAVESFDLARSVRDQRFPLLLGDRPSGLALTADGLTLVVSNAGSDSVTILDAPALAERSRVTVGREPVSVLIDPTGARAIVFQLGNDSLALVDLARGAVVGTLVVEGAPLWGAFDPRGELLYVIHRHSPLLAVVDLAALAVTARPYVGGGAQAIAVDPRNGRVFVARAGVGGVEVFDPSSLLPVQTVDLGADATFLIADPESEQVLAALPSAEQVLALRLAGGAASAVAELGGEPRWIDVAGRRRVVR